MSGKIDGVVANASRVALLREGRAFNKLFLDPKTNDEGV